MKICLIGFQGSGKTTLGRWVSSCLGVQFFDLDEVLLARYGFSSIKEAYTTFGEKRFRKEESVCISPIAGLPSYVVALGGGSLEALQQIPDDVHVVYLFRPLEQLESENVSPYPLWVNAKEPQSSLRQRWEERHPVYVQRATSVVLVEKQSVDDDGHRVLQCIRGLHGK